MLKKPLPSWPSSRSADESRTAVEERVSATWDDATSRARNLRHPRAQRRADRTAAVNGEPLTAP
ncbi:MAG: hypothetical protein ACLSVD_02200 [Eggerthellaceae bacterium]